VADGQPGEVTMKLRDRLTSIQYGKSEDSHAWMTKLA
jgi:branched-chain amino acid aminotransferase